MNDHVKLSDLRRKRAVAFDTFKAVAEKKDFNEDIDRKAFDDAKKAVTDLDAEIKRVKDVQELAASTAQPVEGQERTVPATVETDRYVKEKSLVVGAVCKMIGVGGGTAIGARQAAAELYGESHPVTKALMVSVGTAGGIMVPPDQMTEVIELLRPKAVVRASTPRIIPMPRGTMTLPGQASAASAGYGGEVQKIAKSEQKLNAIVASFKKLTALVPVSNDMMRYANPATDAFVRDDLVKVLALREDKGFLLDDGTAQSPRGMLHVANAWAAQTGGTVGKWSNAANSVAAVGGNFITSAANYALATAAAELGGLDNKLDTADVPADRRVWFMHPRTKNYLFNVQNSLGVYVYRDELTKGTLLGHPYKTTTQIPINIWDADGTHKDCSFIILAEMTEAMIFDSMQLELAVSREGTYIDANGDTISAFQNDQTLIRAIEEHDFQMRHEASVAVSQLVRWAPAIQ